MGWAHLIVESPRAQAEESHSPNSTTQPDSLGIQPRTVQSSTNPKSHQKKKRGKIGIKPNLKENLRISEKAALIAVQCATPGRAVL